MTGRKLQTALKSSKKNIEIGANKHSFKKL